MPTRKSFDKYVVRIYGGEGYSHLFCYYRNGFVGKITFYPDNVNLPRDYLLHTQPTTESIWLYMPISRFESVMSIVRFEKPLNLFIDVTRGGGTMTQG